MANYNIPVVHDEYLDLQTIEEFKGSIKCGLCDDHGHGHPVKDDMEDFSINIYPSEVDKIPEDATHISWYNK